MATGLLDNYILPAEVQREANFRGLLGTLIGIGQASGPSPVPVGLGTIAANGAAAGLGALDAYERGQTQRSLLGAQIGKLKSEQEQKQRLIQYANSLPPGQERDRLLLEVGGINSNRVMGDRPYWATSPDARQSSLDYAGATKFSEGMGGLIPGMIGSAWQTRVTPSASGAIYGSGAGFGNVPTVSELLGGVGLPGGMFGGGPFPAAPPAGNSQSTVRPPPVNIPQQPLPSAGVGDVSGIALPPGAYPGVRQGVAQNADLGTGSLDNVQMAQANTGGPLKMLVPPTIQPGQVYGAQPERRFDYRRGDAFGGIYEDILKRGMQIGGERQKLARLDMLLDQVYTGMGGDIAEKAKQAGQLIGVDLGKVGPGEAANALANEFSLTIRNPAGGAGMPGAMSDADREYLRAMVPGLANTKEGRKLMLETRMKLLDREQEIGRMARAYVKRNKGQLDEGFLDELESWSAKNPLFGDDDRKRLESVGKAGAGLPDGIPEGSKQIGTKDGKPVYLTPDNRRLVVD